jgi:hypothetical protein
MTSATLGKEPRRCGVSVTVSSDGSTVDANHHPDTTSPVLEVDLATLARAIREQKALPLTDSESDRLARSLEGSRSDEELLANTLAAVRLLVNRLEPPPQPDADRDRGPSN